MEYQETYGDLFTAITKYPTSLMLLQCISADAKMGAGIAAQFRHKYAKMARCLDAQAQRQPLPIGQVIVWHANPDLLIGNLVTKPKYYQKPSYGTLKQSLESVVPVIQKQHIKTIALPMIGSGLDRLKWPHVKSMLNDVFRDVPVQVVVYLQ